MNINEIANYVIAYEYRKVDPFEILQYMSVNDIIVNNMNTQDDVIAKGKKYKNIKDIKVKKSKLFKNTVLDISEK
jgi:hypothetical protein